MADTRRTLAALQALLADNTSGDISAQDVRDFLVSAIGANVLQTGGLASLPSSDQLVGDLYLPTDAPYLLRWNGSVWRPYGPLWPMTLPVNGDFSWINQSGASVSAANGGIFLQAPAAAPWNLSLRVKTAPATPYTVTAAILPVVDPGATAGNAACGLAFRESGTGELHVLALWPSTGGGFAVLGSTKFASPTSFSAHYVNQNTAFPPIGNLVWLRIADTGVNRTTAISADGVNFITYSTIGRTDFLTADQVGFFVTPAAAATMQMTLLSWVEA